MRKSCFGKYNFWQFSTCSPHTCTCINPRIRFGMPKFGKQTFFHQTLLPLIYSMALFFHSMHLNSWLVQSCKCSTHRHWKQWWSRSLRMGSNLPKPNLFINPQSYTEHVNMYWYQFPSWFGKIFSAKMIS